MYDVKLRDVMDDDLKEFFEHQKDREANYMAAFTSEDPQNWDRFIARWNKIMANDEIIKKTITVNEVVVGNVSRFEMFGEVSVSYWIDRRYWGKGIATNALKLFLDEIRTRPLNARVAKDNIGSLKVLEKCGFTIIGEDKGFSNARKVEVEEFILTLKKKEGGCNSTVELITSCYNEGYLGQNKKVHIVSELVVISHVKEKSGNYGE